MTESAVDDGPPDPVARPTRVISRAGDFSLVAALFGPLFVGLVFHGFCIRFGWLQFAAVPIDGGARFRGRPLFGENKTYRGVLAVALGSGCGYWLQGLFSPLQPQAWGSLSLVALYALGFGIGVAAMLSELPNSFVKRRLSVAPGAAGTGPGALLFYLCDQVDFLVGAWLVVAAWVSPTVSLIIQSIVFVVVVHQLMSFAGARLGMRDSAR